MKKSSVSRAEIARKSRCLHELSEIYEKRRKKSERQGVRDREWETGSERQGVGDREWETGSGRQGVRDRE